VPVPAARVPVPSETSGPAKVDRFRAAVAPFSSWIVIALVMNLIWLGGTDSHGHHGAYWPIWVIGPWGVMMVMRWLNGGSRQSSEMDRRRAEHEARQRAIRDNRRAS
jgi:hypothetical protein